MKTVPKSESGFTLVELLIASLMASILTFGSFEFYSRMHNSTITQEDISDMQLTGRNTLDEIAKTLGNAGFKVPSPGYKLVGDSLKVFSRGAAQIDTVTYYLRQFTTGEYALVAGETADMKFYKLMRKVNSAAAVEFSTNVKSLTYNVVNPNTIDIVLTLYAGRTDDDYEFTDGFRTLTATQRVFMRNL
jgi:prepilin-type N-terminal cleavage/methylation domain-containing protein